MTSFFYYVEKFIRVLMYFLRKLPGSTLLSGHPSTGERSSVHVCSSSERRPWPDTRLRSVVGHSPHIILFPRTHLYDHHHHLLTRYSAGMRFLFTSDWIMQPLYNKRLRWVCVFPLSAPPPRPLRSFYIAFFSKNLPTLVWYSLARR